MCDISYFAYRFLLITFLCFVLSFFCFSLLAHCLQQWKSIKNIRIKEVFSLVRIHQLRMKNKIRARPKMCWLASNVKSSILFGWVIRDYTPLCSTVEDFELSCTTLEQKNLVATGKPSEKENTNISIIQPPLLHPPVLFCLSSYIRPNVTTRVSWRKHKKKKIYPPKLSYSGAWVFFQHHRGSKCHLLCAPKRLTEL
jgi:hypothetical protein